MHGGDARPLSARAAGAAIKDAARQRCLFVIPHARAAMRDDGLDDLDLVSAIRLGKVVRIEQQPTPRGDVARYTLEGPTIDDHEVRHMAVVFEVPRERDGVPIITVWAIWRGR